MSSSSPPEYHTQTLCVHAGYRPSPAERGVVAPIAQSVTFLLDDESYGHMQAGRPDQALIYTRIANPTLDVVQRKLAALEGAERALLFSSGMAAIHAALAACVRPGGRIVAHHELYGSAWDLMKNELPGLGLRVSFADLNDAGARAAALAEPCDVVYCESLSNPTLVVSDLPAIARATRERGATLVVDATFATPVLQKPLALGAHVVVHSATKYLAGHSDVMAGVVACDEGRGRRIHRWLQLAGGCLDPHAAFLLDRGLKTLPLRMRAHVENACELARFLARQPRIERVLFPGLESHPTHALAKQVLSGPGGMLSCVVAGGDAGALAFLRRLRLALEASSLGSVETLVSMPSNTSHARLSPDERARAGIAPGLVRVSVGIEDPRDLIADFEQALRA
jgi:cystathionine beta-lyase/cystathionine gamma-synthase